MFSGISSQEGIAPVRVGHRLEVVADAEDFAPGGLQKKSMPFCDSC